MQNIDKRLDDIWSQLVKAKAGNKCEVCGKTKSLNSHHIFSRANKATRWDVNNGICLCVGHHIGSKFSAHKTPLPFSDWLQKERGENWYNLLLAKSRIIYKWHKFEKELLLKELQKELNKKDESKLTSRWKFCV